MKKIIFILPFILFLLGIQSCIHDPREPVPKNPNEIVLKWNQSYSQEKMDDAILGLYWALSHCGAKNANATSNPLHHDSVYIRINLGSFDFDENAYSQIIRLHRAIQNSEEYIYNYSMDLGRYITLLIGASNHYYRITNMPETLGEQLSNYTLSPYKGYVNNSSISNHHRSIQYSSFNEFQQILISTEIDSVTGRVLEFETMELMENGQFKYGIYNADSQLIASAPPSSTAGKPAKCMWCHESNVNLLVQSQNNYGGYLSFQQLQDTLLNFRSRVQQHQATLQNGVDFNKTLDHTQMELQYIMFMNPSSMRLANEWNMNIPEIENLLKAYSKSQYPEFPFLSPGYDRNVIDGYSPNKGLVVSREVREYSSIEVNHIN